MFDMGWTELLLIGIVSLIVVGPKDLPVLFRKVGQFVGKAKAMAREFSRAMEDAADDAGIKETASSLRDIANPKKMGLDAVKDAVSDFKKWDPESETAKLAADRQEAKRKIQEATANKAAAARAAEVRAARDTAEAAKAAPAAPAASKTPAKKPAAKKPAAKSSAAKAPATKAPAAKAAAAKKPAAGKPAAKAPAAKPAARKPAAKKTTPKTSGTRA